MWELAPGSPWKAMRVLGSAVMLIMVVSTPFEDGLGPGEIMRRVDPERHGGNDRDVDAHASFHGAQLLQLLAKLEPRGGQADEAGQCGAAIGIEPDVMEKVALAP